MLASMLYLYTKTCYMKKKVSNVEFARQTNTDTKSLQCWIQSLLIYQNMLHEKEKCPMFSLHDKLTLTQNLFNGGFNVLHLCQNMLHKKEKCPMLSLHDKPSLTPNIFNADFNALPIYRNMLYEKKVSNVEFARQTNTDLFNAGFNALLTYQNMLHEKKSVQC